MRRFKTSSVSHQNKSRNYEKLVEDGEKYSRTSGVELKFSTDEELIDWVAVLQIGDTEEIVKRCMAKHPAVVPTELTIKKFEQIVSTLPGIQLTEAITKMDFDRIISAWDAAYRENLEKVMFDNLSSYEP